MIAEPGGETLEKFGELVIRPNNAAGEEKKDFVGRDENVNPDVLFVEAESETESADN